MRRFIAALACAASLAGHSSSLVAQDERTSLREYPSYDQEAARLVGRLALEERVRRLAKERPADADTIKFLIENNRIDEALAGLRLAATAPVATLEPSLSAVAEHFYHFTSDEPQGHVGKLAAVLDLIRPRLSRLPREDSARLARQLASIDGQMDRGGSREWADRMKQFVADYGGTETALLTEIELIGEDALGDIPAEIDRLLRFAEGHPASVAGAKALFLAGFQLHVNIPVTGVEQAGSDPTPRFLKVFGIYKELQSDKYPPSEWRSKAPELVSGFFVSSIKRPVFAPGNLDAMIDGYREFVFERFNGADGVTLDDSVGYIITSKLGELFALKGDRSAALKECWQTSRSV